MNKITRFLSKNAMLVVLVLVLLFFEVLIAMKDSSPLFLGNGSLLQPANLTNLIRQNGYVVILATGMLLCILTGGNIDLSVGSIVILVGAFSGFMIVNWHWNPYLSIVLCLMIATLLGAWQAFWIAYVRIPPFVTTLAGMLIFRGLALVLMDSKGISPYPPEFINLFNSFIPGNADQSVILSVSVIIGVAICALLVATQIMGRVNKKRKGYAMESLTLMLVRLIVICAVILFVSLRLGQNKGIPVLLVLLGAIVLVYSYYTQNTVPGRYLYALGGNAKAARLSGVNTKRMMFFAYTNMGFLAGIAAMVSVARFNQASTVAGTGYEMDAIGSCFVGGASAYGGIGTVSGAVIGAIFFGVLNMGMSIMGTNASLQDVIKGLVLLAAVIFDVLSKNRKQAA